MRFIVFKLAFAVLLISAVASVATAQPPIPRPTMWTFLGFPPKGKIHGHLFNRRGNHPGLEKKPPLKALGDAANLESEVPAIKKAAEVKQAEDLKPQKIKAVKYLTEIGCGCYDKDGSITEALVAATDDCTEDVRLATVQAIAKAAQGACCANCGETCCCGEDIVKRLAVMAYEKDDKGCPVEPSARVRQAAAEAIAICCPDTSPVEVIDGQQETPNGKEVPREFPEDEFAPPVPPEASIRKFSVDTAAFYRKYGAIPKKKERVVTAPAVTDRWQGVVVRADTLGKSAHVHFSRQADVIPVGTKLAVYRNHKGQQRTVGQIDVIRSFRGSAEVRVATGTSIAAVTRGDIVSTQ